MKTASPLTAFCVCSTVSAKPPESSGKRLPRSFGRHNRGTLQSGGVIKIADERGSLLGGEVILFDRNLAGGSAWRAARTGRVSHTEEPLTLLPRLNRPCPRGPWKSTVKFCSPSLLRH